MIDFVMSILKSSWFMLGLGIATWVSFLRLAFQFDRECSRPTQCRSRAELRAIIISVSVLILACAWYMLIWLPCIHPR